MRMPRERRDGASEVSFGANAVVRNLANPETDTFGTVASQDTDTF